MMNRILLSLATCVIAAARFSFAEPIDLELIARPEAHATLVNPQCSHCIDEAKRRINELRSEDRVLAWTRGKYDGGGIPYRFFLVPYRVISDTYGVFVFDPDAGFARGFEPSLDFVFHGWRGGVMVMKHKDGTLYSTLSGRAFAGPRTGDRLKPIATIATDWGYWHGAYPGSVAYHMFDKYRPLPIPDQPSNDSIKSRGPLDPRLKATDEVLGVDLGSAHRAYRLADLERAGGVLHDRLAGQDIVVLWYAPSRTAAAYSLLVDDTLPAVQVALRADADESASPFIDRNTSSRFGIEGRAQQGPLKGKSLGWLDSVQCRWFAWSAEYPDTEIFDFAAAKDRQGKSSDTKTSATGAALLVPPGEITLDRARRWRGEGFSTVVALLDEQFAPEAYRRAATAAAAEHLDLYYWIEVARNRRLAEAHPEWMAALGMHDDWRRDFPRFVQSEKREVVKAFPWVPIGYTAAFDAHLQRVQDLIARVPKGFRGLLVNGLQGGPSSCGCGNLQCRWALDYHVPKTAELLPENDVAARWLARVKSFVPDHVVIPVWTTECEEIDLSSDKRSGGKSTGLCGDVGCATSSCPKEFSKQWRALCESHSGPIGVLLTESEFNRQGPFYGPPGAWIARGVDYLDRTAPQHGAAALPHERLWLVVQGDHETMRHDEAARRDLAAKIGAGMVLVARTRLDQSYEPRILRP